MLSFLNEVELMICNGRKLVSEPEWTRVRPSLKQKSIIDYIITDAQLLQVSGNVHVDGTDIGSSDHLLVWMELGRASKTSKKRKRVIRRWRLRANVSKSAVMVSSKDAVNCCWKWREYSLPIASSYS